MQIMEIFSKGSIQPLLTGEKRLIKEKARDCTKKDTLQRRGADLHAKQAMQIYVTFTK
jgi:hypothetical protein